MIEFLLVLIVVGAVIYLVRSSRDDDAKPDEIAYRVGVALHSIRRRLELADLKAELRSDAARLRRELRQEMDADLEQWLEERRKR